MTSCSIKWCGKNTKTSNYKSDGITFHRFPKDPKYKEKWMNVTRRENWFPSNHSVMCSRHFTPDCFFKYKMRRRLFSSAVPTLFLPLLDDHGKTEPNSTSSLETTLPLQDNHVKTEPNSTSNLVITLPLQEVQVTTEPNSTSSLETTLPLQDVHFKTEPNSTTSSLETTLPLQDVHVKTEPNSTTSSLKTTLPLQDVHVKTEPNSTTSSLETTLPLSRFNSTLRSPNQTITILPAKPVTTDTQLISDAPQSVDIELSSDSYNPSAYNCPIKKRMCRKIIDLSCKVDRKNKQIRNLRQNNTYLKKKIRLCKEIIQELKEQNDL